MKKILSSVIVLSLLFLCNPTFAAYPTATPHLLNKGNMLSSPATPYIGDQNVIALLYGALNLSDSPYFKTLNSNFFSLSTDIPLPALGKSVVSIGYDGENSTTELKSKLPQEKIETKEATIALQCSSKFGEAFKGSVKVRMEKTKIFPFFFEQED